MVRGGLLTGVSAAGMLAGVDRAANSRATAQKLGHEFTFRPRGKPKKEHQFELSPFCLQMDFTGYNIFDSEGIKRIELDGNLDAQTLAYKLIDEWIPFFECKKCGRADYCKYTQTDKYRSGRLADIRCGIIVEAITNFVRHTFPLLEKMTTEQVQAYLDGAFHLEKFLYNAEQATGWFINDGILQFFGEYAPRYFGYVINLREDLNKAASEFRILPDFASNKALLFVEGETEEVFLKKLRESRMAWFYYLAVEVYGGCGNRDTKRIQMLLESRVNQGYNIFIQGDADGKDSEIFLDLCEKGAITKEHSFVFRHDFESAIPPEILYQALRTLGKLENVEYVDFEKIVTSENTSVVNLLNEKFHINIKRKRLKIRLAEAVGDILNRPHFPPPPVWWHNEEFMETELGKFLKFIMHVR